MKKNVVLITGGLTGIGRATAIAFAAEGHHVVVSGRHEKRGNILAAQLSEMGADAAFMYADVRYEADIQCLVQKTLERFGRIDVAVNNAGTEGSLGPITDASVDNYEATFAVNVLGTLLCLKHQMHVMLAQHSGSIINLSSVGGRIGFAGGSIYAASKHAVEGLTKSAALEGAAAGVRVNAVAPGPVETDMLDRFVGRNEDSKNSFVAQVPARRTAAPEEIAQTILFLASDKARYLTGQCIAVDGGYTAQ